MPAAPRTQKPTPPACRDLLEYVRAETGPALKVDAEKAIIFGVRVLGRFSRNAHGHADVAGTEYTRGCMEDAVRRGLYRDVKVKIDHPADRQRPAGERPVASIFGVLRNDRVESDENGDPCIRADLHYLSTHEMAAPVVEDVTRRLGVYGLSHNAASPRDAERVDPATHRLVIESLALVRSVDLVDKPATNRNLWESEETPPVPTTRRELLEAIAPETDARKGWLTWLLEDDLGGMDAPLEAAPEEAAEPADKLWAGIVDAIMAIANQYREGGDPAAAAKKIGQYLKAHAKLTGDAEPDDVEEDDEMGDMSPDDGKGKDKTESELETLRAEKKVRQLCESMDFAATELDVSMIAGLPEASRRKAAERLKAAAAPAAGGPRKYAPARSAPPPPGKAGGKPAGGRNLTESAADDLAALHG